MHPSDSNALTRVNLEFMNSKSAVDWLIDAANAIGKRNKVDLLTENVIKKTMGRY